MVTQSKREKGMEDSYTEWSRRFDAGRVIATYEKWPALALEGHAVDVDSVPSGFRRACILGMGGSASGGDIISSWLSGNPGSEVSVFKGQLPASDMEDTFALACSVSGGTMETIEMMKMAVKKKATVVSISHGGALVRVSSELGVPHLPMPEVLAPRYMLPFIIFSCVSILERAMNLGRRAEAEEAIREMKTEGSSLMLSSLEGSNDAKKLATRLVGKVPVAYGSRATRGVGVRFKNVLNENAKVHSHFDLVPDAFHNEIEAWEDPSTQFSPMFLRHPSEPAEDGKRMDEMMKILADLGKDPAGMEGRGRSGLAKLVTMVYRLDMSSYYLAVRLGRDPLPTGLIDRLKSGR